MTISLFNTEKMKREVWCPSCKKYSWTIDASPVCEDCFGKPLITVVYSIVDNTRITGNDELGPRSS
jgi:hypothetical protein